MDRLDKHSIKANRKQNLRRKSNNVNVSFQSLKGRRYKSKLLGLNNHTNLVHVSPVLAVVIEALPHHAHDL